MVRQHAKQKMPDIITTYDFIPVAQSRNRQKAGLAIEEGWEGRVMRDC